MPELEPQSEATAVQKRPTFDMTDTNQTPRRNATNNSAIARATSRTSAVSRRSELVRKLTMPPKPVGPAPPLWQGIKAIVLMSWINVLLVFVPISWACHFALPKDDKNDTLIFVFSFLAIIPLAKLLAFATDELSLRVGQTLAGLLNATLGNAVELIVAIIALVQCQLQVVQASRVTQLNSSLLTISVIAVLLPAAFHTAAGAEIPDDQESKDILAWVADGVSPGSVLRPQSFFSSLFSHKDLYDDNHPDIFKSTKYQANPSLVPLAPITSNGLVTSPPQSPTPRHQDLAEAESAPVSHSECEDEEEETPQMSVGLTVGLLVVVTVIVAVTAEWLVDSIDGLTDSGKISKEFVGLILLPIVGNAAEHVTAVTVSVKDKLTLSLGVAVGSSIQIALFVIPFIVTLGWIIGKPLSLLFDPFESIVLFLSVIVVNYVVQDGKSNWLEGMILMSLYVIIAVTFWYYPGVNELQQLLTC
uniref:TPR_REGION domain-containing protein n=1 Tax=Ganoderma boninense TaxID=34458 RepID=A0A5K1K279_9APHY|nr:TPR_REGION domain-containing protein [Ganoderma boninense]